MDHDINQSQFVHFGFYKISRDWWRLPREEQLHGYEALVETVQRFADQHFLQAYSLLGIRPDVDFMLWKASERPEDFQELAADLLNTPMAGYLETPYAYFSMTRESQYVREHTHTGQENSRTKVQVGAHQYLCVYPFVKTDTWYQLPFAKRQEIMKEHFTIGHKYPNIKIHTTYSFGLDDQEFVLAFETNDLNQFLKMVMELRESAARPYTLRDTPIFTCIPTPLHNLLLPLASEAVSKLKQFVNEAVT